MAVRVAIKGIGEVQKRLERIKDISPELIKAVNLSTAMVSSRAKARAPVDKGTLRNSIHARPASVIDKKVIGIVYTALEYAPYVEFGTGRRGGYPYDTNVDLSYSQTIAGQVAQPFMYPALLESEADINEKLRTAVIEAATRR
ncbi:HK97 gp10 family phage protein [Christensenellaceae bacterium OttesenSCG-928-L17]|nr:HK97 gp10 family phage protein [Christensenellaceae bacterium OttesenSCG-928-L17]